MSKGINISEVAELETPAGVEGPIFTGKQPTVADLVRPGTGYTSSSGFACVLSVLDGE